MSGKLSKGRPYTHDEIINLGAASCLRYMDECKCECGQVFYRYHSAKRANRCPACSRERTTHYIHVQKVSLDKKTIRTLSLRKTTIDLVFRVLETGLFNNRAEIIRMAMLDYLVHPGSYKEVMPSYGPSSTCSVQLPLKLLSSIDATCTNGKRSLLVNRVLTCYCMILLDSIEKGDG